MENKFRPSLRFITAVKTLFGGFFVVVLDAFNYKNLVNITKLGQIFETVI